MEETRNKTAMQKTQIFNVIILDRSGSMQRIRNLTLLIRRYSISELRKRIPI